MESKKPTRDERSWVIVMAEAGIKINSVVLHLDIHKTTAYRIINCFWQTRLAEDRPRSGRHYSIGGGTFHLYHIKTGKMSYSKPALLNVQELSLVREYLKKLSGTVSDALVGSNIDIFVFSKHFYDRFCAPYKYNLGTMHAIFCIEWDRNRIYCKTKCYQLCVNFKVSFCNEICIFVMCS